MLSIAGIVNATGRSRRGGQIRSRHKRSAVVSPVLASSIAVRVIVSASFTMPLVH